ncbi:hypothetical protein E2320_007879 [Naja naja]|nr:hypothetical protein E2320_007879 [Naja naja]
MHVFTEAQRKRLLRLRGPTRVLLSRCRDVPARFRFLLRLRNRSNFTSVIMAAGLSGMFGNQGQVPPPPPPLWSPEVKDPRDSFRRTPRVRETPSACFASLVSQDYVNGTDQEEIRTELRNELQRKETLIQKHLGKLRHWQQVLDDINIQQKKPTEMPQGPLAYLEQASANIPAPLKQI